MLSNFDRWGRDLYSWMISFNLNHRFDDTCNLDLFRNMMEFAKIEDYNDISIVKIYWDILRFLRHLKNYLKIY